MKQLNQEPQYNGWLVSTNVIKRSFAVMGHMLLAYGILLLGAFGIGIVFGMAGLITGI